LMVLTSDIITSIRILIPRKSTQSQDRASAHRGYSSNTRVAVYAFFTCSHHIHDVASLSRVSVSSISPVFSI